MYWISFPFPHWSLLKIYLKACILHDFPLIICGSLSAVISCVVLEDTWNTQRKEHICTTNDGLIECTLCNPQLKEYCPEVANISFQEYSKNISSTVFNLRRFSQQGHFTLALNNRMINLKKN